LSLDGLEISDGAASARTLTRDAPSHLGARPEPEFAQVVFDVNLNRTLGNHQPLGNVAIAQPVQRMFWATDITAASSSTCRRSGPFPPAISRGEERTVDQDQGLTRGRTHNFELHLRAVRVDLGALQCLAWRALLDWHFRYSLESEQRPA
jgi:hypothetical protein